MIWKATIVLNFLLCVLGNEHHAISEQHINVKHKDHSKEPHDGKLSHVGPKEPENREVYVSSYPSYEFSYKVHDPHTHDIKGQHETRKGDEVKGEYWLIEPDDRKRIVTYHADKHSGFYATVHFSDDHHHEHKKNEDNSKIESSHENNEDSYKEKHDEKEKKEDEPAPVKEERRENEKHDELSHDKKNQNESYKTMKHQTIDKDVGKWIHGYHLDHYDEEQHKDYKFSKENKFDNYNLASGYERVHEKEYENIKTGLFINIHGSPNIKEHGEWHAHKEEKKDETAPVEEEGERGEKQEEGIQENAMQEEEKQKEEQHQKEEIQNDNDDNDDDKREIGKKEIAKWSHDRHSTIHGKEQHFIENKYDNHYLAQDDGGYNEKHKDIGRKIFKMDNHGHNRKDWHGFGNKFNRKENINIEHLEDTHARPSLRRGAILRENYYHPRFNKQIISH